jgi:C4-dicarboxylate-binding protein DctP
VKKPFSEVFMLLQTNAIDGTENPWSNIFTQKFFEVQDYITESNHGLLDYLLVTSAEFWNELPDDVRPVLDGCIAEATKAANDSALAIAMEQRQKIIDSGATQVLQLSPEEKAQWREAMKPVWAQFQDNIGADLIEAAQAANN